MEKCKNSVFGVLIKISISILNFSTGSSKKPRIYRSLFLIAFYFPRNDNMHPSKMRIYYYRSFSRFMAHFDDRPKILSYREISPNVFFACKLSYENNSQLSSQSNRSATATHSDTLRVLYL